MDRQGEGDRLVANVDCKLPWHNTKYKTESKLLWCFIISFRKYSVICHNTILIQFSFPSSSCQVVKQPIGVIWEVGQNRNAYKKTLLLYKAAQLNVSKYQRL